MGESRKNHNETIVVSMARGGQVRMARIICIGAFPDLSTVGLSLLRVALPIKLAPESPDLLLLLEAKQGAQAEFHGFALGL